MASDPDNFNPDNFPSDNYDPHNCNSNDVNSDNFLPDDWDLDLIDPVPTNADPGGADPGGADPADPYPDKIDLGDWDLDLDVVEPPPTGDEIVEDAIIEDEIMVEDEIIPETDPGLGSEIITEIIAKLNADLDNTDWVNASPANVDPATASPAKARSTCPWPEEVGSTPMPASLIALSIPIPELLYVLLDSKRHCHCYLRMPKNEDCGLLCFANSEQAFAFMQTRQLSHTYDQIWPISLDQARQLAREGPSAVNCLFLVGRDLRETVHYIR